MVPPWPWNTVTSPGRDGVDFLRVERKKQRFEPTDQGVEVECRLGSVTPGKPARH